MATGRLLGLKIDKSKEKKSLYKKYLVVGNDLFSIALYKKLLEKHGPSEVALLCVRPITKENLLPIGPSTLRGKGNIDLFKEQLPAIELEEFDSPASFYKELKWRQFGGRAKSEKLLWNEEFFTEARARFDLYQLYPFLKEEDLLDRLNNERLDFPISSINHHENNDLVEMKNYKLSCANGIELYCERLFWGAGAGEFLNYYNDKNSLSDEFIEFCEKTHSPSALYVCLEFDKEITDRLETLFIPLSYTHDWGHFVGEFISLENGGQRAEFVTFLDKNESTEDEVSKKIRLLKRNLEKIFEKFSSSSYKEFIKLASHSACLEVDDDKKEVFAKETPYLQILSDSAPLESSRFAESSLGDSGSSISWMARGAIQLSQLESKYELS